MKQLLTTIAALVLVGCGPSVDNHEAARTGNIEVVKQYLAAGGDVNAISVSGTPLDVAIEEDYTETADLLRKHGAKTAEELDAAGN